MTELSTFKSFRNIILESELEELIRRNGFPSVKLTDIATKIIALKGDDPDDIEHLPNSIYLPKIGNSPVVNTPSNMKIKPKNYYQIQFNEDVVNGSYISNYFNTEIGRKHRLSLEIGAIIPQISKLQLKKCILQREQHLEIGICLHPDYRNL